MSSAVRTLHLAWAHDLHALAAAFGAPRGPFRAKTVFNSFSGVVEVHVEVVPKILLLLRGEASRWLDQSFGSLSVIIVNTFSRLPPASIAPERRQVGLVNS